MTYQDLQAEWDSPSPYIICHTSGSTGLPSRIELPKLQMKESARRTIDYFKLDSDSLLYSCISPDFIGGKMMLVRQNICGCSLKWEIPSNRPLANYDGSSIDLLAVVPSQLLYIADNVDKMPDIKNIIVGGAPVSEKLRRRAVEKGLNVFETYGMTETASHVAIRKLTLAETPFKVLNGIDIDTINDCLQISISHWKTITTNDIVKLVSPCEFYVLGRKDNVIISGGKKINPEAVENKLAEQINERFAIASVPDEKWGEMVVLILEKTKSNIDLSLLESHERPRGIIHLPTIPVTPNGKTDRTRLKQLISLASKDIHSV